MPITRGGTALPPGGRPGRISCSKRLFQGGGGAAESATKPRPWKCASQRRRHALRRLSGAPLRRQGGGPVEDGCNGVGEGAPGHRPHGRRCHGGGSVRITAAARGVPCPPHTQPGLKRSAGQGSGRRLLCTSRSSKVLVHPSRPVAPGNWRMLPHAFGDRSGDPRALPLNADPSLLGKTESRPAGSGPSTP